MRSKLRELCCRFIRFAYLVDFVALSSLHSVYNNSLLDLHRVLTTRMNNPEIVVAMDSKDRQQQQTLEPLFNIYLHPNFHALEPTFTTTVTEYMPPPTGTSHISEYHIIVHTHLKVKKVRGRSSKKRLPGEEE